MTGDGPEPLLRPATVADTPTLVEHRSLMVEEIRVAQHRNIDPAYLAAFNDAYDAYLRETLPDGRTWGWVVEAAGVPVASGAMSVIVYPPLYSGIHGPRGLLYGLYTVPAFRRRGLAKRIVQAAIESCRERGLSAVLLHASDAGRPLYESMGFTPTSEMRLVLDT
jgi:GNAT superfamily N-acetyltransferase